MEMQINITEVELWRNQSKWDNSVVEIETNLEAMNSRLNDTEG